MKLISNQADFSVEFERCCKKYSHLSMFTAWVGNPGNIIPYSHLENLEKVNIYLGISFDQSNPEGIKHLMDKKYGVIIIDDKCTYHPKLYFFKSKNNYALLMGSSNFTYGGFYQNVESNILLEGKDVQEKIKTYLGEIKLMVDGLKSFIPDNKWLNEYRKKYKTRQAKLKLAKVKEETVKEDKQISYASWLSNADWKTYMRHINAGMRKRLDLYDDSLDNKISLLNEYKTNLHIPWKVSLFQTIENRRRILGIGPYGWLGHIGASDRIQQLLANGTIEGKRIIVNAVNRIAKLESPLNYASLQRELENLEQLGPTTKVWGRILAIARPELFCTISYQFVRESLSELLDKPKSYFGTVEGYIELLRLIHQSPWYNSSKPKDTKEQRIWENRVAFLDVVFY